MLYGALTIAATAATNSTISAEQWIIVGLVAVGMYLLGWLTLHIINVRRRNKKKKK